MESTLNIHKFMTICTHLAFEAGNIIRNVYESSQLNIKIKDQSRNDPVTEADFKAQTLIIKGLNKYWPQLNIVGQEEIEYKGEINYDYANLDKPLFQQGLFSKGKNGEEIPATLELSKVVVWIDPLDATKSYTQGVLDEVTTLIGVSYQGRPRLGIVGNFYVKAGESEKPTYEFSPKVYLADSLNARCTIIDAEHNIRFINPRKHEKNVVRLCTTRSKIYPNVLQLLKKISTELLFVGGMGKKTLEVLENKADTLVYLGRGISTWDISANEALILSVDGKATQSTSEPFVYEQNGQYGDHKGTVLAIDQQLHGLLVEQTKK